MERTQENSLPQNRFVQLQEKLQSLLQYYGLTSTEEIIQIIIKQEKSLIFKKKHIQYDKQDVLFGPKLGKLAIQHTYHQMFIYYQQFPMQLQECKKALSYKYVFDQILRTHLNRKSIWLLCSGALFKIKQNPNFYQNLLKYKQYPQFFQKTIQKDVVRTLQQKCDQNQKKLNDILRTFAKKNPYIGYCQGMNFIVNFLIMMQFSDQQIFWILTCLLEDIIPVTYYTNMMGVAIDIQIIQTYIKFNKPKMYQKLKEMNVNISLIVLQWLVCLFTTALPFYLLTIVWDLLFIHGSSILIKVCLVLLDQLQEVIEKARDLSQLLPNLQTKKKNVFIEQDQFICRVNAIYIDQNLLNLARSILQCSLMKQKIEVNLTLKPKKQQEILCSIVWPVCFRTLKQHKSDLGQIQVWTFKEEGPPKSIPDYLTVRNKKSFKPPQDDRSDQKKLMIGRFPHSCNFNQYNMKMSHENQVIQMNEYRLLNRRMHVNNLQKYTQNLHMNFYQRATQTNLAFLNFGKKPINSKKNDFNQIKEKAIEQQEQKKQIKRKIHIERMPFKKFLISKQKQKQNSAQKQKNYKR